MKKFPNVEKIYKMLKMLFDQFRSARLHNEQKIVNNLFKPKVYKQYYKILQNRLSKIGRKGVNLKFSQHVKMQKKVLSQV